MKNSTKRVMILACLALFVVFAGYRFLTKVNINPNKQVGRVIDALDGIPVFYNGGVNHVLERNTASDGYNIGLKYQCVEFVKRYYFEHLNHRMPDSYGHAKDFFDAHVEQGELNLRRGLKQYINGQNSAPQYGDILVYKLSLTNPYGHVAIVSGVNLEQMQVEIIQQNPGPFSPSRETYRLSMTLTPIAQVSTAQNFAMQTWQIENKRILGWLRL